jgi:Family of unknown function (DUF6174)
MRTRIWMTAALLSQLSAAALCSDKAAEKRQLEINRSKWASHGIKSYQFRLRDETCSCMYGPYYGPIRVIVNDGEVTKAIYEGERRDGYWFGRIVREKTELIATVDEVFARAENLIKSEPARYGGRSMEACG